MCIRHFSDVFGPRAKAICTSALKLSTMENMLIMMNFNDFRPDRKFKMAARGRFSRKKIICLKSILGHSGPKKIFFFQSKNFSPKNLENFLEFVLFCVLDIFMTFLDLEHKLLARVH